MWSFCIHKNRFITQADDRRTTQRRNYRISTDLPRLRSKRRFVLLITNYKPMTSLTNIPIFILAGT